MDTYPLTVIAHRNRKPLEDFVIRGAVEAASLAELEANSTTVFLCLTSSREVASVIETLAPP